MAEARVRIARVAANTSTGNQDITTTDLGGLTPKGVLLVMTHATVNGVAADNAQLTIGASDGTRQWVRHSNAEHAQGTTDTSRSSNNATILENLIPGESVSGSFESQATFVSFITNGVRINWSNAPPSAYLITAIFFAGADVSVHADDILIPVQDVTDDITTPGFEPSFVFMASHADGSPDQSSNGRLGYGYANNDDGGTVTQSAMIRTWLNGTNRGEPQGHRSDTRACGKWSTSSTTWKMEVSDFDSSGFSITTRDGSFSDDSLGYLAVRVNGLRTFVGSFDVPTATGDWVISDPNFRPQFVSYVMSMLEVVGTDVFDDTAGSDGISSITAAAQFSNSAQDEDFSMTSDTQSISEDKAFNLPDDDGTVGIEGDFVSFDAPGWTTNLTVVKANAKKWFALAIEEEPGVAAIMAALETAELTKVDQGLSNDVVAAGSGRGPVSG